MIVTTTTTTTIILVICAFCLGVFICALGACSDSGGQQRASDPLELAVSRDVPLRTQFKPSGKNKCSEPCVFSPALKGRLLFSLRIWDFASGCAAFCCKTGKAGQK